MERLTSSNGSYTLESGLEMLHTENKSWLSNVNFWKRETDFLNTLLAKNEPYITTERDKKELEHFQNRLLYYRGEVLDELAHNLREEEHVLAQVIKAENSDESTYRKQHLQHSDAVRSFEKVYNEFKDELFTFIEQLT
ncbi:MAG: hypothetical protein ACXWEY_13385 [Bacteroidia bacterium]